MIVFGNEDKMSKVVEKNVGVGLEDNLKVIVDNVDTNFVAVSDLFCYRIWLHSYCYKFEKHKFETKIPDWGKKDYKISYKF